MWSCRPRLFISCIYGLLILVGLYDGGLLVRGMCPRARSFCPSNTLKINGYATNQENPRTSSPLFAAMPKRKSKTFILFLTPSVEKCPLALHFQTGLVSLRCIPLQDETGQHIAPKGTDKHQTLSGFWGPRRPPAPGHFEPLQYNNMKSIFCYN